MALMTVQKPVAAGSATFPSLSAATVTVGDTYRNSGKEMLVVNNASGGAITVTFVQRRACSHGFGTTTHDIVQSVATGAEEWFPPVNPNYYNDDNGLVTVVCSSVTSVTIGVVAAS